MLAFVGPDFGAREAALLSRRKPSRVVFEDARVRGIAGQAVGVECLTASDLVTSISDVHDTAAREPTAMMLRRLRLALGAGEWFYAGVSLWDTVMPDFHWRYLDGVFQAANTARQLLDRTKPARLLVVGLGSPLARAVLAIATSRGIAVETAGIRTAPVAAFGSRVAPLGGHIRDCVRAAFATVKRPGIRPPFVILNHAGRNFQVIEPVVLELQRHVSADRVLVVQTGTDGEGRVQNSGVASTCFEHYASMRTGLRALASAERTVDFLRSGRWRKSVREAGLVWEGVPLEELAEPEISRGLPRLLCNTIREISCARAMLLRERPAVIVTTEDRSSFTRSVAFAARALAIPSVMVQWGPITRNTAWIAGVATDVAAVEGEVAAEVVRACENEASLQIVVTGQPKYDWLRSQGRVVSRRDNCEQLGLDSTRPIVLYAAHPLWEKSASMRRNCVEEERLAEEVVAVRDAVLRLPGVQLVIKPHPNEGSNFHLELAARTDNADFHVIAKAESVYPALFACDLVVTRRSSVGLEGLLIGKPLVLVNFSGQSDPLSYVREGVALGAYCVEDVQPAIHAALFDAERRTLLVDRRPAFLRRHTGSDVGSATDRMVKLILGLERGLERGRSESLYPPGRTASSS